VKSPKRPVKSERTLPFINRDSVLELLSRTEVASVTAAEAAPDLAQGDEYLDLMNLSQGVRRALGAGSLPGRVLPKKAVLEKTWNKILMQLPAPSFMTAGPRRE
jgi:hypothetical protein